MFKNRYAILWILILAAVLRFVQIDTPPVGRHAWRQTDTASVARNFYDNDHRLLYPQIDWQIPGYVEMEFPIYPWTASLLYVPTGESLAIARSLAILGSLVTILFLYLLVQRILGRGPALWAALLYSVLPANLYFARAIMPESWMLAATAVALYGFQRWIDEDSWGLWSLALLATTLACLLKLTSLYLGLPFHWLAWRKWGPDTFKQKRLWLFGLLVTVPVVLWYLHAYRLGQEYGASFHILTAAGSDKWGTWRLLADPSFYHRVFIGYLGERMLTWVGLPIFVIGLFMPRTASRERLLDVWLLAVVTVLLLASGGSFQHDYYSLPLVLPAVVFMSKVFDRGWRDHKLWLVPVVVLILVLSAYRHTGALAEERQGGPDLEIAKILAAETAPEDLVVSCMGSNPTWLYLADRRGWGRDCSHLGKTELHSLIDEGARYLVSSTDGHSPLSVQTRLMSHLRNLFEVTQDNDTVFLVRLSHPIAFENLSWSRQLFEDFSDATALASWSIQGSSWAIQNAALTGVRIRKATEARTIERLPDCEICEVRLSISLARPPGKSVDSPSSPGLRGAGRNQARAAIDLWHQPDGTGLTLTLSTRRGHLSLHQSLQGHRVDSDRVELPLRGDQPFDLTLRSDGFELEVWIDGRPVLTTVNRLPSPLSGWLAIRPRLGSVRLHQLEIRAPSM